MFCFCLAFVFFVSCIDAVVVPFTDCGSNSLTVQTLDFDCEEGKPVPCTFIKGKTYHGRISLTTKAEISEGDFILHAKIGTTTLPFPLPEPDICSGHNLTCPVASGAHEVATIELKVPTFAPSTNLVAKVEIRPTTTSPAEDDDMCVEFLAKIEADNDITI